MAGEWESKTLAELAAHTERPFAMGPFGSNIRAENYRVSGVPVIRGLNLSDPGGPRFIDSDFVFLSEEKADELSSSNAFLGDLVFVAQGTIGKVGLIPLEGRYKRYVLSQNLMKASIAPDAADPMFVFYYFRSQAGQHEILSRANPTGVPCISRPLTSLKSFEASLPALPEQQAIACILGALDDKIELNRRMNQTLEGMVRAIFKSWFVDFDPVRAKAAGEPPSGLAPAIADLFPDEFEESELGEIPKGWEVEPIGDIVRAVGGGTPSTKNPAYWGEGVHCFATPKDLSGLSSPMLLDTERRVTDAGLAKISSGLLPVETVLLSSRAPVGYLAIAQIPVCVNQGFIAMICDGKVSNYYVLNWAHANMPEIKRRASGTTFAEISKRNFRPIPALVPSQEVMTAFNTIVEPVYTKIRLNLEESRALAALRDTLLPRLISGELRVPDAEKFVEAAV